MATLFDQIVQAVHEALAEPELPVGVFRLAQSHRTALRRVVWVPTSFESLPVKYTNPGAGGELSQRAIGTEMWQVECHITGDSFEDAERLRERILWATRVVLGGNSKPSGGSWVNQEESEAQVMLGSVQKVIQSFSWRINVLSPEVGRYERVGVQTEIVLGPTQQSPAQPPLGELVEVLEQPAIDEDDDSP